MFNPKLLKKRVEKRVTERPENSHHYVNEESILCVEGFPRSGNTYLLGFFLFYKSMMNSLERIGHHTHDILNFQYSVALGIPTYVCVRAPEDAVSSALVYLNEEPSSLVEKYCEFYLSAWRRRESLRFVFFEQVTEGVRGIVEAVSCCDKVSSRPPETYDSEISQWISECGESRFAEAANRKSSVPHDERSALLEAKRKIVMASPAFSKAFAIYRKILYSYGSFSDIK